MSGGRLSRQTMILVLGTGVQTVVAQTVVNLFLVRHFETPEQFGSYRQVWLVVNTLLPVFLFGLHLGLYYYLPMLPTGARRRFLLRSTLWLVVSGLGLSLGLSAAAPAVARLFDNPSLVPLLRAIAFYPLVINPSMLLYHFHIAEGRAARAAVLNIAFFLLQSILIVGMVAAGRPLTTLFQLLVGLGALRLLQTFWEIRRFTSPGTPERLAIGSRTLLAYALPVGMAATVAIVGEKLDKFVVSALLDPASFAIYSVGAVEFPLVPLVAAAAITVLRPRIASLHHRGEVAEILGLWGEATRKLAVVLIPMGALLAVVARPLIEFLYTPEYGSAAGVFRLFLPLILLRMLPFEPLISSMGLTRMVLFGGLIFLGLDLVLNLALVAKMGILGPPVATVIATAGLSVFYLRIAARHLEIPPAALLPWKVHLRVLVAAGIAAAAAFLAQSAVQGRLPSLLLALAAFAPVYLGLTRVLGVLRPGDLAGLLAAPAAVASGSTPSASEPKDPPSPGAPRP